MEAKTIIDFLKSFRLDDQVDVFVLSVLASLVAAVVAYLISLVFRPLTRGLIGLMKKAAIFDRVLLALAERKYKFNVFWRMSTVSDKIRFLINRATVVGCIVLPVILLQMFLIVARLGKVSQEAAIENFLALTNAAKLGGSSVVMIGFGDYWNGMLIFSIGLASALSVLFVYAKMLMFDIKWADKDVGQVLVDEVNIIRGRLKLPLITGNEARFRPENFL